MKLKMLMVGESGVGKTHACIKIAKESNIKTDLIDVDEKADIIIDKLDAHEYVNRLDGTPFPTFIKSLDIATKSSSHIVVVDSLTELKDIIKRYIKEKILLKGEFYMGGIERKETTKIDRDTFIVSWELHPVVYDRVRDIIKKLNSAGKSFIMTYHPPTERASAGEIKMLREIKRICNMTVSVDKSTVDIKTDLFCDKVGTMDTEDFVKYVADIVSSNSVKEVIKKWQ